MRTDSRAKLASRKSASRPGGLMRLALLAALLIGDQIRLNRPAYKYRLSIEVSTPSGVKSASGVLAVHPYRGYGSGGKTKTKGDALFVDLGNSKNLIAILAHGDGGADADEINYLPLRAYTAAGRNVSFRNVSQQTGTVPITGALVPVLLTFSNPGDPKSARVVAPDDLQSAFGDGTALRGVSVEAVPNGLWPLDFGGPLGTPVTRGVEAKLRWWNLPDDPAETALRTAGLKIRDAKEAFTRK